MKLTLDHFSNSGKIIARAIGPEAAYKLLQQYGGQSFYISESPTAAHAASKKLGIEVHRALSQLWPNQEFELPVINYVEKRMRNDEIREDSKNLTMRELIQKYQLTRYQIQKIINSGDPVDRDKTKNQQLKFAGF
jgi:Mor family transcriptional regulator